MIEDVKKVYQKALQTHEVNDPELQELIRKVFQAASNLASAYVVTYGGTPEEVQTAWDHQAALDALGFKTEFKRRSYKACWLTISGWTND